MTGVLSSSLSLSLSPPVSCSRVQMEAKGMLVCRADMVGEDFLELK